MSLPLPKRLAIASDHAVLLFIPALAVAILTALRSDAEVSTFIRVGVTCSVPAAATILFTLLLVMLPSLAAGGHRAAWTIVTLPLVFVSLLAAGLVLGFSGENPIIRPPVEVQPALGWLKPTPLALTALGQMAILAIRYTFSKTAPSSRTE